jgi:transcriptional regulator with XRE-family HTH domain
LEQLARSVKHLPFAQLISEARQRQGLSLNGVARAMHAAARNEGTHCGTTRQAILGYERGRIPHPDGLRWLAAAVGLPLEQVTAAAGQQRRRRLELRLLASTTLMAPSTESQCGTLDEDVERRELLLLFSRAATAGLLASTLQPLRGLASPAPIGADTLEAAMTISTFLVDATGSDLHWRPS